MTKKRKIEVLNIAKKYIQTHRCEGLCSASTRIWILKDITRAETFWLDGLIVINKPKKQYDIAYYWKPFNKIPRIKWINARIKELQ